MNPATIKIPDEIRAIFGDMLTERGLGQWWSSRSGAATALAGMRPCEAWQEGAFGRVLVIEAANSFASGDYI